ncbi:MAG: class I SAM-dependent methyltransferase [Planctomycetota bacterium]
MPQDDPFAEFKAKQREGWSTFAPVEVFTTPPAGHLVRFAEVRAGQNVLDVGTGTGVVALTARRLGAKVSGLDLTPKLLERARENAKIAQVEDIEWREGDAESLPYADASFDVVLSQFGHMFAPRPDVTVREMLRVLKPGGRIAFATWPPEHMTGQMFSLVGRYAPPPPPGAAPPPLWGNPAVIIERLGAAVRDIFFQRGIMSFPTLSPQHYRHGMEQTVGPIMKLVQLLASDQKRLAEFRGELEALASRYLADNVVRQDYLVTRATKTG